MLRNSDSYQHSEKIKTNPKHPISPQTYPLSHTHSPAHIDTSMYTHILNNELQVQTAENLQHF